MVLGGIVVASFFAKRSRIGMIIVSSLVFGGLSIGLGLSPTIWLFFGFMFLFGLGVPFFSTPSMTLLQETVEPERQGRVFGFLGIVMALAMPIGMVVFGPLADVVPIEWLLVGSGVLTFLVVAGAVWLPAGRRAVGAAREASHVGDPATRRGRRRRGHARAHGPLGSTHAPARPDHPAERVRAARAAQRSTMPTSSPRRPSGSSTPGTPRCPPPTASSPRSSSGSPGTTRDR